MTLRIWVDKQINKIRILTDDPSVKFLLEKTQEETKYIPWEKRWGTLKTTFKIYDKVKKDRGMWNFILGLGWAGYIIGMFQKYMSPDDYNGLLKDAVYSDEVRTFPFPGLRDYQNQDVLHILKYRQGLFSCYTGYGRREATLNYIVKNRVKTVKGEIPNTVLTMRIATRLHSSVEHRR